VKSRHDERGELRAFRKRLRRQLRPRGAVSSSITPAPGVEWTFTGTATTSSSSVTISIGGQSVTVATPRGQAGAELAAALTAELVAGRAKNL
jgi:hypothetical protein